MSVLARLRQRLIDGRPAARPGRVFEFGKTMLVVVPLTVLIWVYAERAQVGPGKVSLLITAVTAEPNLVAEVVEPQAEPLTINLDGPRGQVESLKQKLDEALDNGRYRVTLAGVDAAVGTREIDATQLLNNDPLFSLSGVTVTGTTPARIRVAVDPLRSVQATVVLQEDALRVKLLNQSFEPATVTLSGPQSAFPPGAPTVYADPSGLTPSDEGGARTTDVPLIAPADKRLRIAATKVRMTYTAGASVTAGTVPSVFIDIVRPAADEDGKSRVVVSGGNVVHNIAIRGPTNLVSKYVSGEQPLRAQLKVEHDDIGKPSFSRDLSWPLIEGGQIKVEGGPYRVTFEVRED